jgi:hypothetical protein
MTTMMNPSDPIPEILEGYTLEEKLQIFLYASEQYHDAIPKAKSERVRRLLQNHLQFCADFVYAVSEYMKDGYNENVDFGRLKQMFEETSYDTLGYTLISRKYPIEDRLLVESVTSKISKFAEKIAKNRLK